MKVPGVIGIVIACLVAAGCAGGRQLPPLRTVDSIVVEISPRDHPTEKIRIEILEPHRVKSIVGFVNAQPDKWRVPWYGPPVGTIYFNFFERGRNVGNFYIGPVFFGRDSGGFWSQRTTRTKIEELEKASGLSLWPYISAKDKNESITPR